MPVGSIDSIDSVDLDAQELVAADRPDLRRRPAPARRDRRRAQRGGHHHPGLPADHVQRPAALGRDGHRHRGADGHRHGPPGRPRRPAPQPRRSRSRPQQVDLVKRSEAGMVTDPVTTTADATLAEVDALCARYRDLGAAGRRRRAAARRHRHQPRPALRVGHDAPRRRGHDARCRWSPARSASPPTTRWRCSPGTRSRSCRSSTTPGRLRGLITVKDFTKSEQYPLATKDDSGRLRVGAAIGFFGDAWERAMALVDAGVDALVRRHRARPRAGRPRHGQAAQDRAGRRARRRHRRQRRHPGGRAGARRRRRGRRQGRGRAPARSARPGWSRASACRR